MEKKRAPKVIEVGMLPNMFLMVKFDDNTVRYWRSKLNQEEINIFKSGKENIFGFTRLTPQFYWIGNDIVIDNNNFFKVNNVTYSGNDIYNNELMHY